MTLPGRTVLLTGAAGGIGAATARELDRRGARLALVDLDAAPLERLAGELRDAVALPLDVTDRAALDRAAETCRERFGGIDVAVANAGIASIGSVEALPPDSFERVIEVNLLGVYRTLHAALPQVRERRGHLVAVSSLAAPVHAPLMAHYSAAKAGVEALCNSMRTELAHHGVTVGVAYFGYIDTGMVSGAMRDPGAAALRGMSTWPFGRNYPPAGAGRAVATGIQRRSRRILHPPWIAPILLARGFIQPLVDAQLRRSGLEAAVRASNDHVAGRIAGMQVIDCSCGTTLQAANEEELTRAVQEHVASNHPDEPMSDDDVRELVASRAYEAFDS